LAESLESIAVGPLHTPRLYSTFLKAVITSKTGATANGEKEGGEMGEPSEPPTSPSIHTSPSTSIQSPHLPQQLQAGAPLEMISPHPAIGELTPAIPPSANGVFQNYDFYFQNDGEMGTVLDVTTFPPTMADHDQPWSLSVDNIFPNTFWDNVLVPGTSGSPAGLSGGFAYGAGVSGLITPAYMSPPQSGVNTPHHGGMSNATDHMMQSHPHHQVVLDPRQQDVRC